MLSIEWSRKKLAVTLLLCMSLVLGACSTIKSYRNDPKDYRALAVASCHDLQTSREISRAGLSWAEIYFPNKQDLFDLNVEPIMTDVTNALTVYCSGADLVQDTKSLADLYSKREELLALLQQLDALVRGAKS